MSRKQTHNQEWSSCLRHYSQHKSSVETKSLTWIQEQALIPSTGTLGSSPKVSVHFPRFHKQKCPLFIWSQDLSFTPYFLNELALERLIPTAQLWHFRPWKVCRYKDRLKLGFSASATWHRFCSITFTAGILLYSQHFSGSLQTNSCSLVHFPSLNHNLPPLHTFLLKFFFFFYILPRRHLDTCSETRGKLKNKKVKETGFV